MFLTFEQNDLIFEMQVEEASGIKAPEGIAGVRSLNKILLFSGEFKDFISALTVDDFLKIREIMSRVVDKFTRELVYHENVKRILVGRLIENENNEGAELLKKLLS